MYLLAYYSPGHTHTGVDVKKMKIKRFPSGTASYEKPVTQNLPYGDLTT